jgi:hypothetical protein
MSEIEKKKKKLKDEYIKLILFKKFKNIIVKMMKD